VTSFSRLIRPSAYPPGDPAYSELLDEFGDDAEIDRRPAGREYADEHQREENRHRIVAAGFDLERRGDTLLDFHSRRVEQREHRRRVGRADDSADEEAL
jgi:hypothetical protein